MSERTPHILFFIGIGGIGMSGLARYFHRRGALVAGYDRSTSPLVAELQGEGMDVQFTEDPKDMPREFHDADPAQVMVVRTPAVPTESPLLKHWKARGARILKRAELLGIVTRDRRTIAVAGTHGKTTVSTMLAHLLTTGGIKCNAFLGGIAANYASNVILRDDAEVNVVEADEFDRSFLHLDPDEAIITSMDPDHMDVYGTPEAMVDAYKEFAAKVKGTLFVHERVYPYFKDHKGQLSVYSLDPQVHFHAAQVRVEAGAYHFDLHAENTLLKDLTLGMPGRHNVENAVAASSMALAVGVPEGALRDALASFWGVGRRFEVHHRAPGPVYIDDYAHHPAEIDACIASARELFPDRRITGVFQPHLFSRTRDLAEGLARSLSALDELLLMDIYPAREAPLPGITGSWLLEQVPMQNKRLVDREVLASIAANMDGGLLLTMGAGDIDRMVPVISSLIAQSHSS